MATLAFLNPHVLSWFLKLDTLSRLFTPEELQTCVVAGLTWQIESLVKATQQTEPGPGNEPTNLFCFSALKFSSGPTPPAWHVIRASAACSPSSNNGSGGHPWWRTPVPLATPVGCVLGPRPPTNPLPGYSTLCPFQPAHGPTSLWILSLGCHLPIIDRL